MPGRARRDFLKTGLLIAGGAGLGFTALRRLGKRRSPPAIHKRLGALKPVQDQTTGLPILRLPEGFRYLTFGWAGQALSDGYPGPVRCDGMGVVSQEGSLITLVRNHEIRGSSGAMGDPAKAWDVTGGGTTTLAFDTATERLESSLISLNGTLNNCAGGVTPWGTWLSCEEAPYTPELAHLGIESRQKLWNLAGAGKSHGHVFEVDPAVAAIPEPLWDMGQFYHEAAAVDPETGVVYLTEDQSPHAGLYRFIPAVPGMLNAGGKLQMLRVPGVSALIDPVTLFAPMDVQWEDIDDPRRGHTPGTHDGRGVVSQGLAKGCTSFRSLEGCVWHQGSVYFTSKNSGAANAGLVFQLDIEGSRLQIIHESPGQGGFSGPDNIVFSPRGNLLICEDRESGDPSGQYLAGLTRSGELYAFSQINPRLRATYAGHQLSGSVVRSEWAGACFSPDGQWMFANVYSPGVTCAITGPWVEGLI